MSFRDEILDIIIQNPGFDTSEIADLYNVLNGTNRDKNDFTKRVSELTRRGEIYPTGKRLCQNTGKLVTTWSATVQRPSAPYTYEVQYFTRDPDYISVKKNDLESVYEQAKNASLVYHGSCRKYVNRLERIQESKLYRWFAPLRFLVDELLAILYAYIKLAVESSELAIALEKMLDEENTEL